MGIKRNCCMYDNEIIGIETVYSITDDGRQINIPEQLKKLRALSKAKKLFCPCGCGINLTLVAGERNLRSQHFRILPEHEKQSECTYQEESLLTVRSKVILKCWLENNLHTADFKYNLPLNEVADSKRKFQMSVYSPVYDIGIVYNRFSTNIQEEKVDILSKYTDSKIFFFCSKDNEEYRGQYPEHLKEIQDRQGYCMYLDIKEDTEYSEVKLKISYYEKNYRGWWDTVCVANGRLSLYTITAEGILAYNGTPVEVLLQKVREEYRRDQQFVQENERKRREALQKQYAEDQRKKAQKIKELEAKKLTQKRQLEARKQAQLEEKIKDKEQAKEDRLQKYIVVAPKMEAVYKILENVEVLRGKFLSAQSSGVVKTYGFTVMIEKVRINAEKERIEIRSKNMQDFYLYVIEGNESKQAPKSGVAYQILEYGNVKISEIPELFRKQYEIIMKP